MDNDRQKLRNLLERFETGMLVTFGQAQGGSLHARPMAVAKVDDDLSIWFLTSKTSPKVLEVEARPEVELVFQEGRSFVAMCGVATIERDPAKLDELWKPTHAAWFPDGKDDPNLVMIRVHGREAEFWDTSGTKGIKYVAQALKAVVSGKRPEMDADQHGKAVL